MSISAKIIAVGAAVAAGVVSVQPKQEQQRNYPAVAFYVCAHQDDWQLFMGADAFRDISSYNEKSTEPNGTKVVLVYTTAGNLNDTDDSKTCDCYDRQQNRIAYWQVREAGANNSVHLAASKVGGYGPGVNYPAMAVVEINGHRITKYEFRNTVSYFLRIKSGRYGRWYDDNNVAVGTVDNSTEYTSRTDLTNTLSAIFSREMNSAGSASFHMPDIDEQINHNDHHDHLIAGRAGIEAVRSVSKKLNKRFAVSLHIDYQTKDMPANITGADAQNEAALTAVYCLSLLDHNAWPEWGNDYQQWTSRNYSRLTYIGKSEQ